MRNNNIKNERKMKNILLLLAVFASSAFGSNPTAPNKYLESYAGDFTDSDGDGMSDVGELRYGFDPQSASSFANDSQIVDSSFKAPKTTEIGGNDNKVYFKLTKFNNSTAQNRISNFLSKVIPLLNHTLGNPAESFVCELYNRGGRHNSWVCVNSGRKLLCDDTWNPRLFLHELVHVWKGKYDFTSDSSKNWSFDTALYGFEESAEGLAYEILHDYIEAYPNDEVSIKILKGGSWDNWAVKTSNFDVSKNADFLGGGDFWVDNITTYDRYNASAVLIQLFQKHDEDFFKKMMTQYFIDIKADSAFRPSREYLIDLWSSIVPFINGVPTKQYLDVLEFLNGEKLQSRFYAVSYNDGKFRNGGKTTIFCAFADAKKGEFWWSSPIRKWNYETKYGIPEWFGKHLGSDGYYYTDNRGAKFDVAVENVVTNEIVKNVSGELTIGSHSDGSPLNIAQATPSELYGNKFEIGLYKNKLTFPEYKEHTSYFESESYFFGYKNFTQSKSSGYSIFVGVDTPFDTNISITIADKTFTDQSKNGVAVFDLSEMPFNIDGLFDISVSNGTKSNSYVRTLLNGGTRDNYRHQTFLIIDRDFDGHEDIYELNQEVVAFTDVETNSDEETITIQFSSDVNETIEINETNQSISEVTESSVVMLFDDNDTIFNEANESIEITPTNEVVEVVEVVEEVEEVEVVEEVVSVLSEPVVDVNITILQINGGLKLEWNKNDFVNYALEVKHGELQLIYGGHKPDSAIIELEKHNLLGNEILSVRILGYNKITNEFVGYFAEGLIDLASYFSVEPIIVQVETNNSVVVVDGVIAIEIDESNTTIINTEDNVVLIDDTQSITEYNEENSSITSDDNVVVISDSNVTLYTNNDETYESNASDSVIIVTQEEIVIEEDTSKTSNEIVFGGDAPPAPKEVRSAWDNAIAYGNNWYYIEWFGYFYKVNDNPWAYHEKYGWFFLDFTTSFDSVWLYHDKLGWMWTNNESFPYTYNPYLKHWICFVKGGYYDFNKSEWVKLSM